MQGHIGVFDSDGTPRRIRRSGAVLLGVPPGKLIPRPGEHVLEHHGLAAGDVVLGVRDRTSGIIGVGIIQHLIRLHRRFGGLRQLQRLIRLLIHHVAAQTGLVFARVICHIGIGGAPAAVYIGLDRERQDQLAAGPGDSTVLIGGLRHRVGCVVKALHSDGLAVGIYHRGNACKRLWLIPRIAAVRVLALDLRILDHPPVRTACQPLREGEELRQRVGQHRVRAGRHLGGAHVIGDGAESVFQLLGIVRREVVVAFRHAGAQFAVIPVLSAVPPPVCNFGIRIVGGHTVHVLVEAAVRIAGVRILKHADGVYRHLIVFQVFGQINGIGRYTTTPIAKRAGLTVSKDHHDLLGFLTGTTQSMLPVAVQYPLRLVQAKVRPRGTGSSQLIDRIFQTLDIACHRSQILHSLGVIIGIPVRPISIVSYLIALIARKLDNTDPVGHIVFIGSRVPCGICGHLVDKIAHSILHGRNLGN